MQNPIKESALADTSLAVFENSEFGKVRTAIIDNEPYFVGKDVAKILGFTNPQKAIRDHVDEEDRTVNESFTVNGTALTLIKESGVYSLVFGSKLPSAKKFKRWVTSEVLPSIRKNGSYSMPQAQPPEALELRRKELGLERARFLRSLALSYRGKSETYPQILDAYAVHEIVGEFALPLPEIRRPLMSAGEVGEILGISAHKVGLLANRNGLKTEENGAWVRDKSRHSCREVDTFRYNDRGLERIRMIVSEGKEVKE